MAEKIRKKDKASKKGRNEDLTSKSSSRIWGEARKEIIPLAVGAIAQLASLFINQTLPRLVRVLMDPSKAKSEGNHDSERTFVIKILSLSLAGGTASFTRTWMMNRAQGSIAARLRKKIFESLLMERDIEWFQSAKIEETQKSERERDNIESDSTNNDELKDKEEIQEKSKTPVPSTSKTGVTPAAVGVIMKDDVDVVANTVTNTVSSLFRSSTSCIFGMYNMLRINPQLVGLSIVVAPVAGNLALMTRKYLKKIVAIQHQAAINSASFVEERLNHIAMVKTSNREYDEVEKYKQIQDECVSLGGKAALASGLSMGILFGLSSTAFCGILLAGRRAVNSEIMTSGQLTSFGTYSFMLAHGTAGLVRALGDYSNGIQCATQLYKLIDNESNGEKQQPSEPQTRDTLSTVNTDCIQKLSIENVCFSYKAEPTNMILRYVSFSLSRGEVVALVGANGSGKSTTASILAGMYFAQSGKILLYKNDCVSEKPLNYITDIEREDQVKLIQVVPQVPVIFNMSILDNVRYSRPDASEDNVSAAMKEANCDFVSNLKGASGYHTGRNGIRLTGGQRQRIGLARAFLVNPAFLVLDEPSSAMDAEGEQALKDTMIACRDSNRGLLIITHCAKSLELADRILVLKEGIITEAKKENGELII